MVWLTEAPRQVFGAGRVRQLPELSGPASLAFKIASPNSSTSCGAPSTALALSKNLKGRAGHEMAAPLRKLKT